MRAAPAGAIYRPAILSRVRCYLIAEHYIDLSPIRAVFSDLGVEVVEPARAFDVSSQVGRGWLPDVDLVCALFPAEHGWETPASIYLEIGQALGADIPVLLIAEPPRQLDAALSPLQVVRVPAGNRMALANRIRLFLHSVGRPPASPAPVHSADAAELSSILHDLADLREVTRTTSGGEGYNIAGRRLERIALRLLQAAGAEVQEAVQEEGIGDLAAWVPGTERFIPGPLLVELKIVRRPQLDRAVLDRLQLYALTRDAQWSVLLYYKWDPFVNVRLPKGASWQMVMAFDIEELASRLREETLAQVLNNERNAIVHGVGHR